MNNAIKVEFCVSYDWYLLKSSLPLIYNLADAICLSMDKERMSWALRPVAIDEDGLRDFIRKMDTQNKIVLFEDNFHQPELSAMQNETRQRNMMSEFMGKGGWHIQLDCDEYFADFEGFVNYLKKVRLPKRPVNICCSWVTLVKESDGGFFYINPMMKKDLEFIQIASREPVHEYGRRNGNFNIYTNFKIIHQSWARSDKEVLEKMNNWGHAMDFEHEPFFQLWKSINSNTYSSIKNLHPVQPEAWPGINFVKAEGIKDFTNKFNAMEFASYSKTDLFLKNSRVFSILRAVLFQKGYLTSTLKRLVNLLKRASPS